VRNQHFLSTIFECTNASFIQDRLGTNKGPPPKKEKKREWRFLAVNAVTKVLEEVDASRHELARLAREDEKVTELLRSAAITRGGGGGGDDGGGGTQQEEQEQAGEDGKAQQQQKQSQQKQKQSQQQQKQQVSARWARRQAAHVVPAGRGSASPSRRVDPEPDYAARRRLAAGRSEWSSDSDDDSESISSTTAAAAADQRRRRQAQDRGRQRSDPWTEVKKRLLFSTLFKER
jgi:hypothetical protein